MCKVSVLIPAYNTERYIERCINSVLNQSLTDIEIIIIDDGSNDGTKLILEKFNGSDSRIKIFHQPNRGIGASRKKAFELSSGKYIQFIDSDDWIDTDFLMTMYKLAEEYNADIVEAGGFYRHDKDGNYIEQIPNTSTYSGVTILDSLEVSKRIVQRLHSCSLCTKLFSKEFCTKANLSFVEGIDFGEDAHFICKACFHHPKYIFTDKIFYHLVNNPTSTTKSRNTLKNFNCRIQWIQDLEKYIDDTTFRDALLTMKFFIKEEAALSGLFDQDQYKSIFPEVINHLSAIKVNQLRKLRVLLAVKFNNKKIASFTKNPLMQYVGRAVKHINQKGSFSND